MHKGKIKEINFYLKKRERERKRGRKRERERKRDFNLKSTL